VASAPIRVLLNASALPERPAGAGIYTIELARALARRGDVDLVTVAPHPIDAGGRVIASPRRGPLVRTLWEQRTIPGLLQEQHTDVYHGAHFSTPLRSAVPRVATAHDLTFYRLPNRYQRRQRWYYRALANTARRAERLIVPSRAVAGDAIRFLGYAPERIRVIAEAPRAGLVRADDAAVEALRRQLGITQPYLLCLGTAEPGKRAIDAIRALAVLREQGRPISLVLAGNDGPLSAALQAEAASLGVAASVCFVGYLADDALPALLTGAAVLVFPSLYEGFGLPPLEAMACGTPVIASFAPAMDDILAGAAVLVPIRDPEAIAREAARLLDDRGWHTEWQERGTAHAAKFSWDRAAAETVDVYREVASL